MSANKDKVSVSRAISASRSALVGTFIISAVANVLMLTGPLFMLQVYDRVLASGSVPTLLVLSGMALGLYLFSGFLDILRSKALTRVSMRVFARLSDPVLRANVAMPIIGGQKTAGVQPVRDLDAVRRFLGSPGPGAIFDLPFMPLYFLVVFLFHPALGLMSLAGGALIFVLVLANDLSARQPSRDVAGRSAVQTKLLDSARRNAEVVSAMGMIGRLSDRFVDYLAPYTEAQMRASDRSNFYSSVIKMLRLVLQSAMLALGAYLAIRGEITAGVMIASSIIMARALAPIEQAVSHWPAFVASRQASTRLNQALGQVRTGATLAGLPLPREELRVSEAATTAPGEQQVLLQGVEFSLARGDAMGVIGPSGSGKTSLARALVGVWPILKGSVRLDGSTIDQWSDSDRGRFIGYLPQDVELFDGTVAENIARFESDPDLVEVVGAAKLAGVHRLIAGLPDGYNCVVGEGGARLSQGQRQRIGLARALYRKPFLVVLDEPNANLDLEGEQALTHAMHELRKAGSIVIVVAHRTSALAAVNKVLMVQAGKQIAFGDRDEILSKIALLSNPAVTPKVAANAV
jgi:PrtD family type I secretion system ABC transporter